MPEGFLSHRGATEGARLRPLVRGRGRRSAASLPFPKDSLILLDRGLISFTNEVTTGATCSFL